MTRHPSRSATVRTWREPSQRSRARTCPAPVTLRQITRRKSVRRREGRLIDGIEWRSCGREGRSFHAGRYSCIPSLELTQTPASPSYAGRPEPARHLQREESVLGGRKRGCEVGRWGRVRCGAGRMWNLTVLSLVIFLFGHGPGRAARWSGPPQSPPSSRPAAAAASRCAPPAARARGGHLFGVRMHPCFWTGDLSKTLLRHAVISSQITSYYLCTAERFLDVVIGPDLPTQIRFLNTESSIRLFT